MLKNIALEYKSKEIANNYFANKLVLYNNPSYMDLFNKIFDQYFYFISTSIECKKIHNHITNKSYSNLKNTLLNCQDINNDTLLELIMLKNFHDEYYKDNYSRSSLVALLDSIKFNSIILEHQKIADEIINKITKLSVGYSPPDFTLYDLDNNIYCLDSLKGKYVYLNFFNTTSYACIKEFELLKNLYQRHCDYIEIVTILTDKDILEAKFFISRKKYNWKFLHYGNQLDLIEKYDIRIVPTYFFIDTEGKLIQSPALSPGENFEGELFKILRNRGVL